MRRSGHRVAQIYRHPVNKELLEDAPRGARIADRDRQLDRAADGHVDPAHHLAADRKGDWCGPEAWPNSCRAALPGWRTTFPWARARRQ